MLLSFRKKAVAGMTTCDLLRFCVCFFASSLLAVGPGITGNRTLGFGICAMLIIIQTGVTLR